MDQFAHDPHGTIAANRVEGAEYRGIGSVPKQSSIPQSRKPGFFLHYAQTRIASLAKDLPYLPLRTDTAETPHSTSKQWQLYGMRKALPERGQPR